MRVAALGFTPISAPMSAVRPLPARLPPPASVQAVVLTSANALPAFLAAPGLLPTMALELSAVPVLAVGDATASRARATGFTSVISADGDAEALAALVARHCTPGLGTLLLPTARREGLVLARRLRAAGFAVVRRAVYVTVPQSSLARPAVDGLSRGAVDAVLFYSAAAARRFAILLPAALPASCLHLVDALALSPAVAAPLATLPWRRIRVAARPTQDALLTLLTDPNDE